MMRFGAAPVIFLVNNRGYAIEILIHDGPYNRIQNWDYTGGIPLSGDAAVLIKGFSSEAVSVAVMTDLTPGYRTGTTPVRHVM
jgi:TPP-dependent 2-oxoacid decarboxylase